MLNSESWWLFHSWRCILFQSWDAFFRSSSAGRSPGLAYQAPPTLADPGRNQVPISSVVPYFSSGSSLGGPVDEKIIDDHLAVQAIIRSYQVRIRPGSLSDAASRFPSSDSIPSNYFRARHWKRLSEEVAMILASFWLKLLGSFQLTIRS